MKKFLLFAALVAATATTFAQSTIPRYGLPPANDNTGRVITWNYAFITPIVGQAHDTIYIVPKASVNQFFLQAPADTGYQIVFAPQSFSLAYAGDVVEIYTAGQDGTAITVDSTFQSPVKVGGVSTASTHGRITTTYYFDGKYWVEKSRLAE